MKLEGLLEEVAVEQKLSAWEGASHMTVWGKSIPSWGKQQNAKAPRWEE